MFYKNFAMLAVIIMATLFVINSDIARAKEIPEAQVLSAYTIAYVDAAMVESPAQYPAYFVPPSRMDNKAYAQLLKAHGWPADTLNTAANASYLSDEEKNMILAMNLIRFDPVRYAQQYVQPTMAFYRGNAYFYPGLDYYFNTHEGVAAVEELFKELMRAVPLPLFYPSEGMSRASASHANYQSQRGDVGHDGQGGMRARIEREGQWHGRIAENIAYGNTSAHHAILSLMIDDGVPGRGHRVNMLHAELRLAGVAWASHPRFDGGVYVIKYAGGFTDKAQ